LGNFSPARSREPILGREAKLRALEEGVVRFGLAISETLAVGDGATFSTGSNAPGSVSPIMQSPWWAAAKTSIAHGDLTALLYLQGYRATEIQRP